MTDKTFAHWIDNVTETLVTLHQRASGLEDVMQKHVEETRKMVDLLSILNERVALLEDLVTHQKGGPDGNREARENDRDRADSGADPPEGADPSAARTSPPCS